MLHDFSPSIALASCVFQHEFDHDNTVTCVDLDTASMRVVSGTKDGQYDYTEVYCSYTSLSGVDCFRFCDCLGYREWKSWVWVSRWAYKFLVDANNVGGVWDPTPKSSTKNNMLLGEMTSAGPPSFVPGPILSFWTLNFLTLKSLEWTWVQGPPPVHTQMLRVNDTIPFLTQHTVTLFTRSSSILVREMCVKLL